MTSTRSPRTPATEVRAALITAGRRILERDGESALTVRAVAGEARVAPMGVYNHFDGKDGLLDAVVSDGFEEFARAISTTDSDPLERLFASGRAYRRFAASYPRLYALMFSGRCRPDPAVAENAFGRFVEVIRYGQAGGIIVAGDPADLALQVWSCVHGAMSLELMTAQPLTIDATENYENVLSLIARGVAPG
ncbi:TetR/AcrR family transcriptional regulator [Gordonia soli]|uniref:Putative TetR family transcriptional regulator n=1 Tax=Gordonia soli NBRC 108243 TaxID=1223545 RepID=M0QJ92_9ACTN|nr:TetR/AcrR family transcriptional regulator [Gordonia soli]GAC67492.1 putative TetR family transcriptional regulator [Gordonia soli NBRC 108243]